MYSTEIVDRRVTSVERAYNIRLHRYSVSDSVSISNFISTDAFDEKGRQVRPLVQSESDFVWNELALSRCDFRYFAERHVKIILDNESGSRGTIDLTPAQELILGRMAVTEERMWKERDAGRTRFDGQCYFMHKSGQMGISTHCEIVGVHRLNFYPDTMGLVASSNDQMTQKLYTDYFLSVYDSLPPWMRSPLKSKVKDRGLDFLSESRCVLQDASQRAAVGQGSKWHYVHLSEVATWPDPVKSFEGSDGVLPRISRSIKAVAFLESTSAGMHDWWHERTESARKGEFDRWQYIFVGWWMVPMFKHDYPPDGWTPTAEALEEATLIERVSPSYTDGARTVRLTREQLYWWSRERADYQKKGILNEFYKAYPSIPEQSFTHSGQSSFEYEVLESLQRTVTPPIPYELAIRSLPSELVMSDTDLYSIDPSRRFRPLYTVGNYDLVAMRVPVDQQHDPRGLILMWEPPSGQHDFFGGADPAVGIANWTRYTRARADNKRDNSAIEIVRRGFYQRPDVQVAEFAAPIFPQDFALYLHVLGKLFKGRNEDREMMWTIEVNNHGVLCQEELIQRYNYSNLYQRRKTADGASPDFLNLYGWLTTAQTIRELWTLGKKHVSSGQLMTNSNWLVGEMRDCQDDDIRVKMSYAMTRGKAEGGNKHDDRVYALLFALEGAHSWTHGMLQAPSPVVQSVRIEGGPQTRQSAFTRDFTAAEYADFLSDWEATIGELTDGMGY